MWISLTKFIYMYTKTIQSLNVINVCNVICETMW